MLRSRKVGVRNQMLCSQKTVSQRDLDREAVFQFAARQYRQRRAECLIRLQQKTAIENAAASRRRTPRRAMKICCVFSTPSMRASRPTVSRRITFEELITEINERTFVDFDSVENLLSDEGCAT